MNDIYLGYYTDNLEYCDKEELDLFFEYQKVIQDDLKRIYRLLSYYGDYVDSKEKESLLFHLKRVIKDITRNRFKGSLDMELNIKVYDNYLIFSYYKLDENNQFILETPSIVIVTRDMKNLYFIDEVYSVFYDEEQDDPYNRGHDEIVYFKLDKNSVRRFSCTLEEYTVDLFSLCFGKTSQFIRKLEDNH